MNISPSEAEEALVAIQAIARKTRRIIASSGAYLFLIVWGIIWLLGFLGSQFLSGETAGYTWMVLDILGGLLSAVIGIRMGRAVRSSLPSASGKRVGLFWLLLFLCCLAAVMVSGQVGEKQMSMYIILFMVVGWLAMGLLLAIMPIWPVLILVLLALTGYFLLPDIFYLWMSVLGGGGMIGLGLYIRLRW